MASDTGQFPAMIPLGHVAALYRYPVKSMQGEDCPHLEVAEAGIIGDRQWALIDRRTERVVSAKRAHRWKAVLQCQARTDVRTTEALLPFAVTLPSGQTMRGTSEEISRALSHLLGRDVYLSRTPSQSSTMDVDRRLSFGPFSYTMRLQFPLGSASPVPSFVDYAPVHLITTQTLTRLAQHHPSGDWHVARFRPNFLIDTGAEWQGFEDAWIGRVIRIGTRLRLRIFDPCPRCVMTTLPQGALPNDAEVWSALSQVPRATSLRFRPGKPLKAVAGVYAEVVTPGEVQGGDQVWLES